MNSRSSANERNLVKFSPDLSTLNQLDTKDGILSFPFDHIYACHSQSSDRRQPLHLAKEIEISTDLGAGEVDEDSSPEVTKLTEQLAVAENHNKKLKDLLIFHLDLIQQQNELITKKEKLYNALKQENDTLKARLMHFGTRSGSTPPHSLPTSTITSSIIKTEPGTSEIILNSFRELLPENPLHDPNKPMPEIFGIARTTTVEPEVPSYRSPIKVPPALDKKLNSENFKMIDNKRSLVKKEVKTENRAEALYTVTSNSGNPIIQRIHKNRRRNTNIGSLSRMSKTPKAAIPETITSKSQMNEPNQSFDHYSVNKKSKMINTYGNTRNSSTIPKSTRFTGSLSDRLQLIDTTPTGEDPYQLGEADMREQSPIPKLMLQKTNHGRMKIRSDQTGETTSRRIYDMPDTKAKINRFMSVYESPKKREKTIMIQDPDLDIVKTETEIAWPNMYSEKPNETSLCEFSYGEASMLPSLDANEFQELFTSDSALNLDNLNQLDDPPEKMVPVKPTTKRGRTTSLMVSEEGVVNSKRGVGSRRGRKRAFSTIGLAKSPAQKGTPRQRSVRGRGGAAARGRKSPVPGVVTKKPYHTVVGDPDESWYFGLDPELKPEDLDPPSLSQASVEVPRWRIKHYTSSYTLEGTENLDDKVFEKRHQKYEAEERRQLRWHMRRVREQRHVEKLRQRQSRDSWCTSPVNPPPVYTLWNRPQPDVRFIEITDVLPVSAFGEPLPQQPETGFKLPWVRTPKAQKRSKRSKTLH